MKGIVPRFHHPGVWDDSRSRGDCFGFMALQRSQFDVTLLYEILYIYVCVCVCVFDVKYKRILRSEEINDRKPGK